MNREMRAWAWLLDLQQLESGPHSQVTIQVRPRDRRVPGSVPVVQLHVFVRLPGKANIAEIETSGVSLFEAVDRAHRHLWKMRIGAPCFWASADPGLYDIDDPLIGPTGPCADGVHR